MTNKLMSSTLQVGLRCARLCALRGPCCGGCCWATRTTDLQHNSTTKSSSFGVGLRSARRSPTGVLLPWILLLCRAT